MNSTMKFYVLLLVTFFLSACQTPLTSSGDEILVNSPPEKRVALVIGNANYSKPINPLKSPLKDADDMSQSLQRLGFEVTLLKDAGKQEMDKAIEAFGQKLGKKTAAFFYFSGHGMQNNRKNFLLPVDMSLTEDSTAKFSETVGLEQVLATMKPAEIQIVALDACRNYPIPLTKGIGTKPKTGLARMRANGAVISYATKPDQVSWDGRDAGKNSYYTKHLKKLLLEPGLTIEQVFQKVRSAVVAETSQENLKQQWPIEENLLRGGEFYFIPPVDEERYIILPPVN